VVSTALLNFSSSSYFSTSSQSLSYLEFGLAAVHYDSLAFRAYINVTLSYFDYKKEYMEIIHAIYSAIKTCRRIDLLKMMPMQKGKNWKIKFN